MQTATITTANGSKPITAGPNAPTTATCPDCGGAVTLRKRHRMDGKTTWFYRHVTTSTATDDDCPRRYRPTM
jgi:hypothetical protein